MVAASKKSFPIGCLGTHLYAGCETLVLERRWFSSAQVPAVLGSKFWLVFGLFWTILGLFRPNLEGFVLRESLF